MKPVPEIVVRPEQFFAALRMQVPIPFGKYLQPAWGEVAAWLGRQVLEPVGPPFIRYLTTDMARNLDIEVGFPVGTALPADERIATGSFPAGRYAVLVYTGSYSNQGLVKATASLLEWANKHDIRWQTSTSQGVEWWRARYESYMTDPQQEPDQKKWQTEITFLISE